MKFWDQQTQSYIDALTQGDFTVTEHIEPHFRTPRTQFEAGISHMPWDRSESWFHSLSGAIALIMGLIGVAVLTWVLVP